MARYIDADELTKEMTEDWFLEILATKESKSALSNDIQNMIDSVPLAYDVEKVAAELKVVFERTVAEILDKTESDFTIADFNLKPFTDRVCAVVRKAGAE